MMASNQLTATTGSGTQTATQSPQSSAAASGFGGQQASSVQPGTAADILNGQGGVPLHGSALSTVSLSPTTQTGLPATPVEHRHVHPVLFGISAILFVIAIVLFWSTTRSVKSTTKY